MRRWLVGVVVLHLGALSLAQTPPLVPPEILSQIEDTPNPLPRDMTPLERLLPRPVPPFDLAEPPTGAVDTPAEYEPAQGLLIAWEAYQTILTQLTVGVTTQDPKAIVYVVVDDVFERDSAAATLAAAGANMNRVEFIVRITDTVWIRDYGPRFILEDENRAIVDHTYNRPSRINDDAFPPFLGQLWNEKVYLIPLTHGGGNFHLFSNDDAFMSTLILNENPGLTEQQVKDYFRQYEDVNLTIYSGFPSNFDSTQHIDMWMFPVGNKKVIIGQYSPSTGQPYTITENATADLTSRSYTVYRTPGWKSGAHYTYTNSIVLNKLVFISKFGGAYAAQDAQALAVYQQAMPDYKIYQIDCSGIINAAGALHCIMMHVPANVFALGDLNCDRAVNNFDIDPFVLALTDPAGYAQAYPKCNRMLADINGDGVVNNFDIDPFVRLLSGG